MRILVLGATGYVGSRLIPFLLDAGHHVVAASSSEPDPDRFAWGSRVDWRRCDVTSAPDVAAALIDVDAVCYLVHSLSSMGFAGRDLLGAQTVRRAVDASGVTRIVYLSGLVPQVARDDLSRHITSRLEVEEELLQASCSTVALRAGVLIGAGSTSFEVIRQLGSLLIVQPVPGWLRHDVQPIAVSDAIRALVEALAPESRLEGTLDLGGPDVVRYPKLLGLLARSQRSLRVRVPVMAPVPVVALAVAALVQAPFWTVAALVESLQHSMVCRPGHTWVPLEGPPLLTARAAVDRALANAGLEGELPSDPQWTRMRAPVLDELHAPRSVRAGASLALHRLRTLWG